MMLLKDLEATQSAHSWMQWLAPAEATMRKSSATKSSPRNLGEDANTTGAICGQLAGIYWGETGIPEPVRVSLARRDMLENALLGILCEVSPR